MLIFWTYLIACIAAMACALAGVLLVVKREAFVSEGISHAVLPGIILAFLVFRDRTSPLLIVSAALAGLIMVWLVKWLAQTGKVKQDAALGIVFSGMFSVGVIASSLNLKNVHFHAHCIIDGNLTFAPLEPFEIFGFYLGPKAFVSMLACLLILVTFIIVFFKELKLLAFDETAMHLLGYNPKWLSTAWLVLVSMIIVAAFEVAGTVLVVALMIAPPAAASFLSGRLSSMFFVSGLLGIASAIAGVWTSLQLEISPTGPIASISGVVFLLVAIFAPKRGLVSRWLIRAKQRKRWLQMLEVDAR